MLGRERRTGAQLVEAVNAVGRLAGDNQMREARHRSAQAFGHRQKVEAAKLARKDVSAAAGKFQDVIELASTEIGIDLIGDRADQLEGKKSDGELDPVGQLHRDDVAALNADAAIKLGTAQHFVLERAVADAAAGVSEHLAVGMRRGTLRDELEEGFVGPQARRGITLRELGLDHVYIGHRAPPQRRPRNKPPST